MSDPKLEPCPFCGSLCFFNHEDATDSRGNEYVRAWVECTGCDMRSIAKRAAYGIPAVKVMLAELWNRRVATPAVPQAAHVDAGELWSFLRNVMRQGEEIAKDYAGGDYERHSARLDAAASKRADELLSMLAAKAKGGGA